MRFSSVVLPIMGINASGFVMFSEVKRAPLSFKVEYIEIIIPIKIMNQLNRNILFTMSKRAKISILTFIQIIWIKRTEFCLVLIWFIQLLYSIMCFLTVVTIRTYLIAFFCIFTKFNWPEISWSFPIFFIMIIRAVFMIVLSFDWTLLTLIIQKFQ